MTPEASPMRPCVMGLETEYSVSGRRGHQPLGPGDVFRLLSGVIRARLPCLPDSCACGMYTAQGSRFYLDHGGHPEWASPELFTPAEVAAYDKASERLLRSARDQVQHEHPTVRISIFKSNLCPVAPDSITFGCHDAYTCWRPVDQLDQVAAQLIPHITTRTIYAGAGCLSTHPEGTGFELSQRARHIIHATGTETTHQRAIFSSRLKTTDVSSEGWMRIHLISKDSQRAPLGTYLTCGATALLMLMINARQNVGQRLQLANPVQSLHALARDPSLQVRLRLADGRQLTALEIQECYLAECERGLQGGGFPDWTSELVRAWRETLAQLAADPLKLAGRLDAYTKLLIFQHALDREGITWRALRDAAMLLARLRSAFPPTVVQAVLSDNPASLAADAAALFGTARHLVRGERRLNQLRFVVRLQALDFSYHELGGMYDQLVQAGQIREDLILGSGVERAMSEPPAVGRAAARGRLIADHHGDNGWYCNWRHLLDSTAPAVFDLGNPFEAREPVPAETMPEMAAWSRIDLWQRLSQQLR